MFAAIPLAWLQLIRERMRLVVALAGISFAVILMMIQLGFRDALFDASITMHINLKADIVLINPQSTSLIAMKQFSRRRLYQTLGVPGVESVTPMYLDFAIWRNPENRKTRQLMVIAYPPDADVFNLPGVTASQEEVKKSDVVLFDEAGRPEFGPISQWFKAGKTVTAEVSGRKVTVGGIFKMGASFGADGNLITSDLNLIRMDAQRSQGLIDVGLIKVEPGADVRAIFQRIRKELPDDVKVLTKKGFADFEQSYWQSSTAIGFIFTLGSAMGFIVGIVIVYQILYTDVSDHLAEYATLKAMGYRSYFLISVVLQEALILSVLGFLPGFFLSIGLYSLTKNATSLPIGMTVDRGITVFILTVVMCVVSGAIAMRKVQAADPADIF
ncbi:MAG: FtsX-like permease family protein [Acaryochloridaceae cyanobacterium RU_4_10]|nr:FtsX-like permease family protein [Acaryochloridaceae cyanobacterium RU_4_10]